MERTILNVEPGDAEVLIRNCDFPAMRTNPLHLIMFPYSSLDTEEDEMKWEVEGLQETLHTKVSGFRKVCLHDGTPIGFAGWSLENSTLEGANIVQGGLQSGHMRQEGPRSNPWHPKTLDLEAWAYVSKLLRKEKMRVLDGRQNIWRLNLISVHPKYQRQGVGSMLMKWGCEEADAHGRDAFLMASPAGLSLYAKFGFKAVGQVQTRQGTFTSMLREAQRA